MFKNHYPRPKSHENKAVTCSIGRATECPMSSTVPDPNKIFDKYTLTDLVLPCYLIVRALWPKRVKC